MTDFSKPENQHPVLKLFPPMSEEDLKELAADIKANGQREAARYVEDEYGNDFLVDGQNRVAACKLAGIEPECSRLYGSDAQSESLVPYVISANLKRRHLTPAQRAAIVVSANEMNTRFAAEAKERQKAALAKANAERKAIADAAKLVSKDPDAAVALVKQMPKDAKPIPPRAVVPEVAQPPRGRTNERLAEIAHVSPALVTSLVRVQKHAPELMPKIIAGDATVDYAESVAQGRQQEEKLKAREQSEKQKKDKPAREFGIWKVGAVLLCSAQATTDYYQDQERFHTPFLFEVKEVRKTHATGIVVGEKYPIEFRMAEKSGLHDARPNLKAIRVATAADKKMVERVWETVTDWAKS